ncbi:cellulose biosynthesis protein BcsN [Bosea sp. 124]|nr:cellulose biosynthesis protein BcsN [Bosea sp. 124]
MHDDVSPPLALMRMSPSCPPALASARNGTRRSLAIVATVTWLGVAVAGCGGQRLTDDELSFATRATAVEPSRALVILPPGAPPVVSVTQRNYDNAISQAISLTTRGRTPGENGIDVAFLTAADVPDDTGVEGRLLPNPSIEDFAIAREMEERLPGVAMAPAAIYVQNRYGPFGYAFGRGAAGDGCLYTWQRIASGDSVFRPKSGLISVRLRVCEPGASEASLLRLAYGYSINGSLRRSGWNPIGDAPQPQPQAGLGEAGVPIYPVAQTAWPDTAEGQKQAAGPRAARSHRPRPVRSEAVEPIPDRPLEGYPIVPPPPAP